MLDRMLSSAYRTFGRPFSALFSKDRLQVVRPHEEWIDVSKYRTPYFDGNGGAKDTVNLRYVGDSNLCPRGERLKNHGQGAHQWHYNTAGSAYRTEATGAGEI